MDVYQQVIYKSRYARWDEEKGRREHWDETVKRYIDFFKDRFPKVQIEWEELYESILNLEVMPSMRALYTAGKALERDEMAGYNCSYVAIDHPRAFDESLYIMMCGTGIGFSVERQFINKLPEINEDFFETDSIIVVKDSKIGWATALRELLSMLWSGRVPKWDLSKLRPAGSKLKTFGGRSSGPDPLNDLFLFCVNLFKNASGRKLTSLECHDLMCMIGSTVVVGGVRRSACLSLSNLSDDRVRNAKSGQWWVDNPQRALANNSAVYEDFPDIGIFMKEWLSLYESKSGERGIVNRRALNKQAEKFGRETEGHFFGLNPCGEVILRSQQTCNLSEVVIRENDTIDSVKRKVRLATILGTLQASLTNIRYVRKIWKHNMEEEALLGVSLTGIRDSKLFSDIDPNELNKLRDYVFEVNKEYSKKLKINSSASVSLIKPSGTVGQLTNASSGIHARYSPYYIRRIRNDITDPLSQFLIDNGIPYEFDSTNKNAYVFSFYQKSPKGAITANDLSAKEQLDFWLKYKEHWTTHNPSCTIYVKEHEWLEVGSWVYNNFDNIGGLSFLPYSDHIYKQAPYEPITEEQYKEYISNFPKSLDWEHLEKYEVEDSTTAFQEPACVGGACELI